MMERLHQLVLALALSIMLPMLVYYGVASIYQPPKWQSYTENLSTPTLHPSEDINQDMGEEQSKAWEEARKQFDGDQKTFSNRLFIIAVVLGLTFLVLGDFSLWPGVGLGVFLGGIATLTMGYLNWSYLSNPIRFISLLTTVSLLLFIAWKHSKRKLHQKK